jgi:hypothetical protein
MNSPYVKIYDEKGELINPINGAYVSEFPNRAARKFRKQRFYSNGKTHKLTVTKTAKYKRVIQREVNKEGKVINIEHYLLS